MFNTDLYRFSRLTISARGVLSGEDVGPVSDVTSDPSIVSAFEIANPFGFGVMLGKDETRNTDLVSRRVLMEADAMFKIVIFTPWVYTFSFPAFVDTYIGVEQAFSKDSVLIGGPPLHDISLSIAEDGRGRFQEGNPVEEGKAPTLNLVNPYNVPLLFTDDNWVSITHFLPSDPYVFDVTRTVNLAVYQLDVIDPENPGPLYPPIEIDPDDPFGSINEWIDETARAIEQIILDSIEAVEEQERENEPTPWYATPLAIFIYVIVGLVLGLIFVAVVVSALSKKPSPVESSPVEPASYSYSTYPYPDSSPYPSPG